MPWRSPTSSGVCTAEPRLFVWAIIRKIKARESESLDLEDFRFADGIPIFAGFFPAIDVLLPRSAMFSRTPHLQRGRPVICGRFFCRPF